MKILIDAGHPATIHLFKNLAWIMKAKGHSVLFSIREKDITVRLVEAYNLDYVSFGKPFPGIVKKLLLGLSFFIKLHQLTRKYKPDIILNSTTLYPALIGRINGIPVLSFHNTDVDPMIKFLRLFDPIFITPKSFNQNLGRKHIRYSGYNELAFLHKNYFSPDISVLDRTGIKKNENIFLLRFVSWSASDDLGSRGLTANQKETLIREFSKFGKVLISSEEKIDEKYQHMHIEHNSLLQPGQMQDLIYYSSLLFGESGAMAAEAALLGVPAFYFSTKNLGFLNELEHKYGLLFCSNNFDEALAKALSLIQNLPETKLLWQKKLEIVNNETIDLTQLMIWLLEQYPSSIEKALKAGVLNFVPTE